jgi:hypothetical protein
VRHILILVAGLSVLAGSAVSRAATFTVTTSLDLVDANLGDGACLTVDQSCSLRAAVQQANALGGFHTIRLGGGPYKLTLQEPGAADPDEDGSGAPSFSSSRPRSRGGGSRSRSTSRKATPRRTASSTCSPPVT